MLYEVRAVGVRVLHPGDEVGARQGSVEDQQERTDEGIVPVGLREGAKVRTVYIAGPMLSKPNLNVEAFAEAAAQWRARGWCVINPAEEDAKEHMPVDAAEIDRLYDEGRTPWIDRDLKSIRSLRRGRGDGIAVLPDWEKSRGARAEVALARWMRLRVWDATTGEEIAE